jgi:hypothetical protein
MASAHADARRGFGIWARRLPRLLIIFIHAETRSVEVQFLDGQAACARPRCCIAAVGVGWRPLVVGAPA